MQDFNEFGSFSLSVAGFLNELTGNSTVSYWCTCTDWSVCTIALNIGYKVGGGGAMFLSIKVWSLCPVFANLPANSVNELCSQGRLLMLFYRCFCVLGVR